MGYYILLIIMTVIGSIASYYLKMASAFHTSKELILNKNLYIGGGLYFLSALINIYILKFLDYSVVLPLTSITYIWTMGISHYKLNENVSNKKIAGVCVIVVGAICVAL